MSAVSSVEGRAFSLVRGPSSARIAQIARVGDQETFIVRIAQDSGHSLAWPIRHAYTSIKPLESFSNYPTLSFCFGAESRVKFSSTYTGNHVGAGVSHNAGSESTMNHITTIALAAVVLTTGCSQEGTAVGPRGGVVVSDDGRFTLEIPEGALDQEVDITIDEVECEQPTAIGTCYEVGPVGLPLLFPGTIVYEIDSEELEGFVPEELTVLTVREDDWKPLADHRFDMADAEVTASAVYLSSYAVVALD